MNRKRTTWATNLKSRYRAIYFLLTRKAFVLITSDAETVSVHYNVDHPGFRTLVSIVDPVYETSEAQASIISEAKNIIENS